MSGFDGNEGNNTAIAGELLDGFDGSIPETIDNSDDIYDGAGGDDFIQAGQTDDTLLGGLGIDILRGGEGNDRIDGGAFIDSLFGEGGDDIFFITGGEDADDVDGGNGFDTLDLVAAGGSGTTLNLSAGTYDVGTGGGVRSIFNIEKVLGTAFDDDFVGSGVADTLEGRDGDDDMFGGGGADALSGGDGDDVLNGGARTDTLSGGDGNDRFVMTDGSFIDNVDGGSGTNTLDLSDIESRGAVIDLVGETWDLSPSFGGPVDIENIDVIIGTQNNDRISSDFGVQRFEGEDGKDAFIMLEGKFIDDVDGGAGLDMLDLRDIVSTGSIIDLAAGTYRMEQGFGGTQSIDSVENIVGTGGKDTVTGAAAAESMVGGNGDDFLNGGFGDDVLTGSKGADLLKGSSGFDRFDFNSTAESGTTAATRDRISDFTHLKEKLDFSSIDARATPAGDQAFIFIGGAAFTAEGQIRAVQSGTSTVLEVNTAGANGAEMTVELLNFTASTLTGVDFIL